MIRDRPDEPAHDFDAEAGRAADKGLGALPRDDLGDLTTLREINRSSHVRCNAFENGLRINRRQIDPSEGAVGRLRP
ncbi:MAG: hypothetical protein DMG02_33735 [Acidobacteria bacterium]|nr:MAG: hypothetical protein DMG02_33735 [Acidobacteriota bacterium]